MDHVFLRGLAVGLAIAAPVGPVGILCIRRAVASGRRAAFIAGLGAALADTFYGAVAGLGLTLVSDFLTRQRLALSVVGGIFLIVVGIRTARTRPDAKAKPMSNVGLARDFLSSFLITLTNPATVLAFMAVFAAMGAIGITTHDHDASYLLAGVFTGSALWWLFLSIAAGAVRHRFHPGWIAWSNRVAGGLLTVFGVGVLFSLAL